MKSDREYRAFQVNAQDDEKRVTGYATTFDEPYTLYSDGDYEVREVIDPGAFDNCDMSDVVMVVDHARDVGSVLARSRNGEGTLEISVDDVGVAFRFKSPDTTKGRDIVALVERGDISECSFAFWVESDRWLYDVAFGEKKYDVRRIESIAKLADLSIVVSGQYGQTSVSIEERKAVAEARKEGKRSPYRGYHSEVTERILKIL